MADIAEIGIKFDTKEVEAGKAAMESAVPSAQKLEQAVESVGQAMEQTATKSTNAARDTSAFESAANGAASSAADLAASGDMAVTALDKVAGGASGVVRAGLGSAFRGIVTGLLGVIGPAALAGAAVGAVTGFVTDYISNWLNADKIAEQTLQKQQQLIAAVAKEWGDAVPFIKQYNDELQRTKSLQNLQDATKVINDQIWDGPRQKLKEFELELQNFSQVAGASFAILNNPTGFNAIESAWQDYTKAVESGVGVQEAANNMQMAMSNFINSSGVPALDGYGAAFDKLNNSILGANSSSEQFQKSLDTAAQQQEKLQNLIQQSTFQDENGNTFQTPDLANPPTITPRPDNEQITGTLQQQQGAIAGVTAAWGDAASALQQYNDQITQTVDLQSLNAATTNAVSQTWSDLSDQANAFNIEYASTIDSFKSAAGDISSPLHDAAVAYQELNDKIIAGTATMEDFQKVQDTLASAVAGGQTQLEGFAQAFESWASRAATALQLVLNLLSQLANAGNTAAATQADIQNRIQGATFQDFNGKTLQTPDLPDIGPTPGIRPSTEGMNPDGTWGRMKTPRKGGGGSKNKKTDEDKFNDIVSGAQRQQATLEANAAAIGLSAEAAEKLQIQTKLLNEAQQKNIELTPGMTQMLSDLAGEMAHTKVATQQAKEQFDFLKDTTKGFATDFVDGIMQGQSVFEAFGNSLKNVGSKLINKALDSIIDKLFQVNTAAAGTGSGGGILGGLFGWVGKLFGGGSGASAFAGASANGSAFASGGVFTNSVFDQPTMFAHASGSLGVMGEKGPEAVVPLSRGANGQLGVTMHNGNSGAKSTPQANVKVTNQYTMSGAISEEKIVQQIQAASSKTQKDVQDSLIGWIDQYNRDGRVSG